MAKTAILLGATGLVGSHLLEQLLKDDYYDTVKLFSRNSTNTHHPKIEEHLINLFELQNHEDIFKGDTVFCCIGTTKTKTPDKELYAKIDCEIPSDAAKLAGANNIKRFLAISSMGANRKSKVFYNRTKGEMERAVRFFHNDDTFIFRPSLISGKREEQRLGETLAKGLFKVVNPILPKKYKSISADTIAKAMLYVSKNGYEEVKISSDTIYKLAKHA